MHPGFQFRFVNKAILCSIITGIFDYVRLAAQRSFDDNLIVIASRLPGIRSILQTYTSIPFNRRIEAPESNMALNVEETIKNLDVQDRFIRYGMLVRSDNAGTEVDQENVINTSGNARQLHHPESDKQWGSTICSRDDCGPYGCFWEVVSTVRPSLT